MEILILAIFIVGYLAITLEHAINVDKAASALLTGGLCWTIYAVFAGADTAHEVNHRLAEHMGGISEILFFLLGAMVIVELIDAHDGFDVITEKIQIADKKRLLWLISGIAFFLSAVLDNLTTTIVMVSLVRKLIADREDRLLFVGMIVIAANAGGAWSPIGDVTTTMLWLGEQISATNIVLKVFLPSIVCLALPVWFLARKLSGDVVAPQAEQDEKMLSTPFERRASLALGLGGLLFVPVFKTLTHLPPFMGMLLVLGAMWALTEMIHHKKDNAEKSARSVLHALRKIDSPSILFFLGILLAVASLEVTGVLAGIAAWLNQHAGGPTAIGLLVGALSAVVDNVPLVAAVQGMYSLQDFPTDHYFWEFLAYCTGTGGSMLIIGSAAGVAAMGMERIDFFWYLKKIAPLALLGYLAGAAVFVAFS